MRHRKKINHLSRTSSHRKAMMANMAASLILHKRINTTVAKAKALRRYVEPLITRSKDDNTHSRRMVFRYLQNKEAVSELFREVSKKVTTRPGGYTRILKTGNRLGDNAEMAMMELVDYNEALLAEQEGEQKGRRRRRRRGGGKKKTQETQAQTTTQAQAAEETTEEPQDTTQEVETQEAQEVTEETQQEPEARQAEETTEEPAEEAKEEEPKAEGEEPAGEKPEDSEEKKDDNEEEKK
ncbi:MAG: 50S ribosomal protein L17 [Bacteroidales bacterium]|nr:50S ribosomal protein L17 [Bacteroidales bacterium]